MILSRFGYLFHPDDHVDLADVTARAHRYIGIGSAISLVPVAAAMVLLVDERPPVQLTLTGILLCCLITNVFAARTGNLNLWPSRLGLVTIVLNIIYGIYVYELLHAVYWAICITPALIFVYGRLEGSLWSIALFLPCAIYVFSDVAGDLPEGMGFNFVFGFALSGVFALAFRNVYTSAHRELEQRGVALTQEEQRFREFASLASDVLFEFDANYRFTFVSSKLSQLVPDVSEDFVGRPLKDVVPFLVDSDGQRRWQDFMAVVDARETLRDARNEISVSGRRYVVDVSMKPRYEGQEFAGYRGVAADVTETVLREAELREKDRVLYRAQKMEAVGQLTSGIAHDFNNLLTVISGNVDLLQSSGGTVGNKRLDALRVATERASDLTSKLLAFARRQPLQPRSVDAVALVAGMAEIMERTLGEDVAISINSDADLWSLLVDASQFEDALLNLAINARDAMPDGGNLQINLRNELLADDENLSAGDYVCVEVVDSGHGIPESIMGQIFDPFFTTKPPSKGSGLGLSMVFGFARQSGGDIRVESESGTGTTVSLLLPRGGEVMAKSVIPMTNLTQPEDQRRKIVVVEDDDHVRELLATILESMGHDAVVLNSAKSGEEHIAEHQVELLITDVVLANGENGLRMAKNVRALAPRLPILLISGYAEPIADASFDLDERMRLLSKPFGRNQLAEALQRLFAHA